MPAHPDSAPAGVIHDIGYRHYDGARLGRGPITRALFGHSLRGAYGLGRSARSKILPMTLFGVMCIPAFIIAVVANVSALGLTDLPLPYERYVITTQGVLTIFLAAQAPQSVSRDLRFKTVPLYFSRPLERVDYVGAKFAAMSVAMFILIGIPLLIMYVGALLAEFSFATHTREVAVALLGAAVFSVVLAGIGLLIASMTPRRGFGVAAIITVLALSYGAVSSLQGIVAYAQNEPATAGWLGLFSPVTLVDGFQMWVFDTTSSAVAPPPGTIGGIGFVLVTFALIGACWGLLNLRYRKVSI